MGRNGFKKQKDATPPSKKRDKKEQKKKTKDKINNKQKEIEEDFEKDNIFPRNLKTKSGKTPKAGTSIARSNGSLIKPIKPDLEAIAQREWLENYSDYIY